MFKALFKHLVLPRQGSVRMKSEVLIGRTVCVGWALHWGPPLWGDLEAFLGDPEILVSLCLFSGAIQFLLRKIFLSPTLGFSTLAVGVLGVCLEKGARRNSHHSGGRPSLNPPLFIQNLTLTFHYSWSFRVWSLAGILFQRVDDSSPEGVRER